MALGRYESSIVDVIYTCPADMLCGTYLERMFETMSIYVNMENKIHVLYDTIHCLNNSLKSVLSMSFVLL